MYLKVASECMWLACNSLMEKNVINKHMRPHCRYKFNELVDNFGKKDQISSHILVSVVCK